MPAAAGQLRVSQVQGWSNQLHTGPSPVGTEQIRGILSERNLIEPPLVAPSFRKVSRQVSARRFADLTGG